MTNTRISNLSCNENEFNKAKPLYKLALENSEFNYSMTIETLVENGRRNRFRNSLENKIKVLETKLHHDENVKLYNRH